MKTDTDDAYERHFEQWTPRGADTVLAAARDDIEEPEYVQRHTATASRRRPSRLLAAAASVALVVLAVGVLVSNRDRPDTTLPATETSAPPLTSATTLPPGLKPPSEWTAEERKAAADQFDQWAKQGWVPWAVDAVVPAPGLPPTGWLRVGSVNSGVVLPEELPSPDGRPRSAMYDNPGGKLIGYHYARLGFVPAQVADAPGFDAGPLYRQRNICEPGDRACIDAEVKQRVPDPTQPR